MSKWETVKLKDLGDIVTGNTPKTSEKENYNSNDIPFIKPSDFDDENILMKSTEFYISETARSKARILPVGSIIMTCIGIIGKIMITNRECAFNQQINAIIPNKNVDSRFIAYSLLYKKDILQKHANAAVVPIINKTEFSNIEIFLPPLKTQCQIAENLDKVTHLIGLCNTILEKLDLLVKARFVEMFGDSTMNDKAYPIKLLSEIAAYWNGLTYKPEDVSEEGTIVLRSSNIQNFQLDFSNVVRVSCQISEKKYVQDKDILMCSRNGSARLVGKVALIDNIHEPMSFGAFMMIIRSEYYSYLMTYFQMSAFRTQIATGATTTINQITGNMLNKVKIPVPDTETITKFSTFVKQIDKSKLAMKKVREKAEMLKKALMQEYFR